MKKLPLFLTAACLGTIGLNPNVWAGNVKKGYINISKEGQKVQSSDIPVNYNQVSAKAMANVFNANGNYHGPITNGTGSTSFVAGPNASLGKALDMKNGAKVVFGNTQNIGKTDQITLEFWMKPISIGASYTSFMVLKYARTSAANWRLYWFDKYNGRTSHPLYYYATVDGTWRRVSGGYIPPLGQWVHVAWNYDKSLGGGQLYINGTPIGGRTGTAGNLAQNMSSFYLWVAPNAEVVVDDLRLWHVTRTPQQIKDNYLKPLSLGEPGLASYWTFDQ